MKGQTDRVLRRCEAVQMVQDLTSAIDNVIELGESGDAQITVETLSLIRNAREHLKREMAMADADQARGS